MTENVFVSSFAGLLHDIGKPLQRNDKGDFSKLSDSARNLQTLTGRGGNSYSHCLWTAQFFENKAVNSILFDNAGIINSSVLAAAAYRHHNPDSDNVIQQIIQLADCSSAGTDREPPDEENEQGRKNNSLRYYERPLQSIFSRVAIEGRPAVQAHFYDACSINQDEAYNPSLFEKPVSYKKIVDGFVDEFSKIRIKNNRNVFLDTVASLVEKWFSCVPSSTVEEYADIPLSDHLLTASAIAAVLCRGWEETKVKPNSQTKLLLVSGDFSGIQNFIFALGGESQKSVAKLIRGRSFMVTMYCKLAARLVTDLCGLPSLCCISATAGRFRILLPDTPGIREKLKDAKRMVTNWAFSNFFGDLKILIDDGEPFTVEEFKMDRFRNVLFRSSKRIAGEKTKCFQSVLTESTDNWIDRKRWASTEKITSCSLCGREPADPRDRVGKNCCEFIDIGKNLTRERIINVNESSDGIYSRYEVLFGKPVDTGACAAIWEINNISKKSKEQDTILPQLNYSNVVPVAEKDDDDSGENELVCKSFDKMADTAEGFNALAVLKADVDNMGYVFSSGFGNSSSISRNTAISRMLNQFFAFKVPSMLLDEKYNNLYTVFSGGDDLSIIGPWNRIIEFSTELQKAFKHCTGSNPSFTISGGISLFKTGFPVYRAVENADAALERAKNDGRNRVNLFGLSMLWESEFDEQIRFMEDWKQFINKHGGEKGDTHKWSSMLYRFLKYWKQYDELEDNDIEKLAHRFRFIYDIRRNIPAIKNGEKWPGEDEPLKSLQVDLMGNHDFEKRKLFQFLKVGISLALYSTRRKTNNN